MRKDPYIGKIVRVRETIWKVVRKKPQRGAGPQSWEHTCTKYYLKRIAEDGSEITGSFRPEQFEVLQGDEKTLELLYAEKAIDQEF